MSYLTEADGKKSSSRIVMFLSGLAVIAMFVYVGIHGQDMPGGTEWMVAMAVGPYAFNQIAKAVKG